MLSFNGDYDDDFHSHALVAMKRGDTLLVSFSSPLKSIKGDDDDDYDYYYDYYYNDHDETN